VIFESHILDGLFYALIPAKWEEVVLLGEL